jgi:hypothetical protein
MSDLEAFTKAIDTPPQELTDAELSALMKALVAGLNRLSEHAFKRELVVLYQVKPANPPQGICAKLGVSVMSEVA